MQWWRFRADPSESIWGRHLLQHHRLPEVAIPICLHVVYIHTVHGLIHVLYTTSLYSLPLFRNLSSVNERTRQQMRDMRGLVDSLVAYIQNSLQDEKAEDKVHLNCSTYVTLLCVSFTTWLFFWACSIRSNPFPWFNSSYDLISYTTVFSNSWVQLG